MITSVTASKLRVKAHAQQRLVTYQAAPGNHLCSIFVLSQHPLVYLHSIELTGTQQYRGIYESALAELVSLFGAKFLQRQSNCASMCGTHIDTHLR
jgi:hypothetical protein